MEFERVVGNKKDYLPLLLLADEQEDMIDRYLGKGEMYLAKDPEVVGECVVCKVDDGVYEIKNIATDPALHGVRPGADRIRDGAVPREGAHHARRHG